MVVSDLGSSNAIGERLHDQGNMVDVREKLGFWQCFLHRVPVSMKVSTGQHSHPAFPFNGCGVDFVAIGSVALSVGPG